MSQIDFDITDSLLSGMKFKAIKDELAFNKLQQAEWQAGAGHRAQMQALQAELGNLEKSRLQSETQFQRLQNWKQMRDAPLEYAGKKLAVKTEAARARGTKADADVAVATKGSRIGQSKSQAAAAQQAALAGQLANVGTMGEIFKGSRDITPQDIMNLAKSSGSPEGVSQDVLAQMIGAEISGMQEESQRTKAQTDEARKQDGYLRMGQTIDFLQRLGPAGAEALKGTGLFPDQMLDGVIASAGGGGSLSPEQKSALGGIDKALSDTIGEQATAEGELGLLESDSPGGKGLDRFNIANPLDWFGGEFKGDEYDSLKKSVGQLQGRRKFLDEERARVTGKSSSEAAASPIADELDTVLARTPTEDDLPAILAHLKFKGIKATEAEVKAYIKSRRK